MNKRAAELLAAVRDLAPSIRERGDEIEATEHIPADLNDQFKEIGLYRMLLPRAYGGDELSLIESLPIIEEISAIDGSVGWTEVIGLQSPPVFSLLPPEAFKKIYAEHGPDVTVGGAITVNGKAEKVDGGYLVSGRWPFASGCHNWDFLFATCPLYINGEQQTDPATGMPATRCCFMRQEQTEILDTWHTVGLCGTGSNHFQVEEPVFVPEEYTTFNFFGQSNVPGIYRYPIIEFNYHIAAIVIGIARGAIEDLVGEASTRKRFLSAQTVAETPLAHYRIGLFETALRAARDSLRVRSEQLIAGELGEDFGQLLLQVGAESAWRTELAVDIVGKCFRMFGAQGIYKGRPAGQSLHRRLRDIYTIGQHGSQADAWLTRAGAATFGQPVEFFPGR